MNDHKFISPKCFSSTPVKQDISAPKDLLIRNLNSLFVFDITIVSFHLHCLRLCQPSVKSLQVFDDQPM